MSTLAPTFEEVAPARTAEAFIEQLRPSNDGWRGDNPLYNGWIFRGQDDASYRLVPNAFRSPRDDSLYLEYQRRLRKKYEKLTDEAWVEWAWPDDPHHSRWQAEAAFQGLVHGVMVRDFYLLADRAGHRTRRLNLLWHLETEDGFTKALARLVRGALKQREREQFAVAQHHGIPTQLLDWTYNPLVAAYFAANPLMRGVGPSSSGSIVVWAVRTAIFRRDWEALRRVTVPPTVVPFLDAQQGLFTWSPAAYRRYAATGEYPCVKNLIEEIGRDPDCPPHWPRPLLRKLTLPKSEVPALLRLLWREGITVAQLMPTWDNVTASLRAKSFLEGTP